MVKVTVECNGEVVTREGNLAVVAVASDEEGKVACEQIVRGHGALYLNAAMLVLAGACGTHPRPVLGSGEPGRIQYTGRGRRKRVQPQAAGETREAPERDGRPP